MITTGRPHTPFHHFSRDEWSSLRADTPLSRSEEDLSTLASLHDQLSLEEVVDIYLPLSRFFYVYVNVAEAFEQAESVFLKHKVDPKPFVIAIAGSVAVGKSTFARVLQALLMHWPTRPSVALVTTDGFLYPNAVLEERGLIRRNGFPEAFALPERTMVPIVMITSCCWRSGK